MESNKELSSQFIAYYSKFTNKELFKKDKNGNLLRDESGNLHKINDDNV